VWRQLRLRPTTLSRSTPCQYPQHASSPLWVGRSSLVIWFEYFGSVGMPWLLTCYKAHGVMMEECSSAGKLHAAQEGMLQAAAKATQEALLQEQKCVCQLTLPRKPSFCTPEQHATGPLLCT
jgi:hypothetical protein